MNNWIFVVSVALVFLTTMGLNFENVYEYGKWHIPLSRINQADMFFNFAHVDAYSGVFSPTVSNVTYINEDTVEILFQDNNFFTTHYKIPNKFNFTATVTKNSAFIAMCSANLNGIYSADIFYLYDMNKTHAIFDHYGVDLPNEVECKYPEIIKYSIDVKWGEFVRAD